MGNNKNEPLSLNVYDGIHVSSHFTVCNNDLFYTAAVIYLPTIAAIQVQPFADGRLNTFFEEVFIYVIIISRVRGRGALSVLFVYYGIVSPEQKLVARAIYLIMFVSPRKRLKRNDDDDDDEAFNAGTTVVYP